MKTVSNQLKTHIAKGSTSLVRLWSIRLLNNRVLRFNDGSSDLFYQNNLYLARPGIQISAIRDSSEGGFADATVSVILSDAGISEDLVRYRLLKDAVFSIDAIDYEFPQYGSMHLFGGIVGDYTIQGNVAELSVIGGSGAGTGIPLGEVYSDRCRNVFGDSRCRYPVKTLEVPFRVVGIEIPYPNRFFISIEIPDDYDGTNTELGNVHTDLIKQGSGVFVVPNCDTMTVTLTGGGGITEWFRGSASSFEYNPGGFGGSVVFGANITDVRPDSVVPPGCMVAHGGVNFDFLIHPNGVNYGGALIKNYLATAYGGDTNTPGGAQNGVYADPFRSGAQELFLKPNVSPSASGGICSKTFSVGPGKDYQVGQQIPYNTRAHYDRAYTDDNTLNPEGKYALPGRIRVVSRPKITTVDQGFNFGTVRWIDGDNAGYTHDITGMNEQQLITVSANINAPVRIGDRGIYRPGCSNYRGQCLAYNNMPNFRAEPDVPNILATPYVSNFIPDPIKNNESNAIPWAT